MRRLGDITEQDGTYRASISTFRVFSATEVARELGPALTMQKREGEEGGINTLLHKTRPLNPLADLPFVPQVRVRHEGFV